MAIELAKDAAEKYKFVNDKKARSLLTELHNNILTFKTNPKNGKIDDGILNYEKAVSLAKINSDKNLKIFKDNFLKVKKVLDTNKN